MADGTQPRVFLSYSRRQPDEAWAARVVAILHGHYGVDVWVDKRGVRTGHDFMEEIEAAIRSVDALVLLGSSSSIESAYCQGECIFARKEGKRIIPLFIEAVSWGDFPPEFHRLHRQELFRADGEEELKAVIGTALLDAGLPIDPARVPERGTDFDQWATHVYPPYPVVRGADPRTLRSFVDECSRKLGLSPKHGYHNLNLALLLLTLGEHQRAARCAEQALSDLPGRADAHYYAALVTAACEPLTTAPRRRVTRIITGLESSIRLSDEAAAQSPNEASALPWLLKTAIAHDCYLRNGMISQAGPVETLLSEARRRTCSQPELDRLLDSLPGLTPWSRRQLESFRPAREAAKPAAKSE